MTPDELKAIKTRREAITMGEGDWHRMRYDDDSLMPDYVSAGQTGEGYSLDVIISECEKPENMEFIAHCPADILNLHKEIERLRGLLRRQIFHGGSESGDCGQCDRELTDLYDTVFGIMCLDCTRKELGDE